MNNDAGGASASNDELGAADRGLLAAWLAGDRLQYLVTAGYDDEWTDYTGAEPPDLQSLRLAWRVAPNVL